ncbi:hypothetical protein MYX76_03085 [Desulfobacterota bacterium AH_259_B03_O07]|nr:hypothetical protein [Desulfobacterota bacterium AH_259_B03_O07]
MNEQFNEFEWLKEYTGIHEDRMKFENIKNFVFFWSLFETKVCKNNANVKSISDSVDELANRREFIFEDYRDFFDYFRDRYTDSGKVNDRFESLNFRRPDKKEFVKDALEGDINKPYEIIKALLIIVYRLRSNLFHGKKRVETLNTQIENFKIANKLLSKVIKSFD